MKVYSLLLIFAVISVIKSPLENFNLKFCEYYTPRSGNYAYSRDFCRSLAIGTSIAYQCCYVKFKDGDVTHHHCVPLSLGQYYDIDQAEEDVKATYSISDLKSLECTSSTYLYGSFLLLLLILF